MNVRRTLALALALLMVAAATAAGVIAAQDAPQVPASAPCAPGAVYDPACDVDHDGDVDVLDIQLASGHWNQAGTWTGGDYWSLTGNAGTTPGTHFLGTADNQSLELRVGGQRALKLGWTAVGESPNLLGGYFGNVMQAGVRGGVIAGGGYGGSPNQVTDDYGAVGGGRGNVAGDNDGLTTDAAYATVSGGSGNSAGVYAATVGGGVSNIASGSKATVGGGEDNTASGHRATVGGGAYNTASDGVAAIVGGGYGNTASGSFAAVGGGYANHASGDYTAVGGGNANTASYLIATVGGGSSNTASSFHSTVGGGLDNTASGSGATVPGGRQVEASHYGELAYASGSFAAGGDAQTSLYVLRQETGDAALTELFLDGSAEHITLANDRVMTFDILVVASHRFGGGSSAGYQLAGVIRNIGGVTAFVGTPIKTVLGENVAGWDVQVEAEDTVDALVVKVQGSSGTTIRWVASVRTVEVGR